MAAPLFTQTPATQIRSLRRRIDRLERRFLARTTIPLTVAATASGDTTLLAAVPGSAIKVVSVSVMANALVNVKFRSGTTDISGVFYLPAQGGFVLPDHEDCWFKTTAGALLAINLSGAVAVGGQLTYVLG